jgi:hypothetical protein|eukprot:scaffold2062_cov273-Chaetoceros_neogracile.AAC.8
MYRSMLPELDHYANERYDWSSYEFKKVSSCVAELATLCKRYSAGCHEKSGPVKYGKFCVVTLLR